MIKTELNLDLVKKAVKRLEGGNVVVTQNLGRNKFVSYQGVVTGVYPSLFTVAPNSKKFLGKISFSYSEILCKMVSLKKVK